MKEELVHQLALELIPGIGPRGVKQLISYCGSASSVFNAPKSTLLKIPGIGSYTADSIKTSGTFREAERIIESTHKMGARISFFTEPDYPKKLKQITDFPNTLYFKGSYHLNPEKSVAIVGTRKATTYGKEVTDKIITELATLNVNIISGLAYGIDIQAHKSALKNNTSTFAILAGGLDRIYPSSHKKYAREIEESGLLITESATGTKPDAHLFPSRNRIIAGLADATIVVEAAERGGALITASLADSYNRPVFAVPGDMGNTFSTGTNKLIASQKALIYTGLEDLIFHLGWDVEKKVSEESELPDLTEEEHKIFLMLRESGKPLEIDLISLQTEIPVNQTASILLSLEFKNLIKSLPGKKYEATLRM